MVMNYGTNILKVAHQKLPPQTESGMMSAKCLRDLWITFVFNAQKYFYLQESSVVLNSISNLEKAESFITSHNTIVTYLDNDEAGRRATSYLKSFGKNLINKSSHYQNHKDLNDYL